MASFPLPAGKPALYPSDVGGLTPPTLSSWQFEYAPTYATALTMGPGTAYGIKTIDGLGALPMVNSNDLNFPRDHGQYTGADSMGGRDISLDLIITGNGTSVLSAIRALGSASLTSGVSMKPKRDFNT